MKRSLIIAGAIVIIAIIIFASVRASGPKAENVYAEPVKARKRGEQHGTVSTSNQTINQSKREKMK